MTEREQALRRLLRESRGSEAQAPAFSRLWNGALAQIGQRPASARWGDMFAAVAATVSVVVIGLVLAIDARRTPPEHAPDPALYELLIARTTWRSPTDVLLDSSAGASLGGLPDLPTVNTNPPLESLL